MQAQEAADAGTATLAWLLGPGTEDLLAARISLLGQACDAVAGLIGESLAILQDAPDGAGWRTEAVLTEVLRYRPPVRLSTRVARTQGSGSSMSRMPRCGSPAAWRSSCAEPGWPVAAP